MIRLRAALGLLVACSVALLSCSSSHSDRIVVGSKNFTESFILGELIAQQIEAHTNLKVERRFYLAGTYICQQAMLAGRIDIYPEYTGTALTAILKQGISSDKRAVYERVKDEYERRFGLTLGPAFGFNDTFAMEIRGEDARRLNVKTLSQAAQFAPQWRAGFGYEFMERHEAVGSSDGASLSATRRFAGRLAGFVPPCISRNSGAWNTVVPEIL